MHVGMGTGFANSLGIDDARFIQEEFKQCLLAAELGFESVWITEHHFSNYSMSPDPLMLLGHLSGRAPQLWLGTQVIVVPWHDPVRVAEQIVLLDHMSGGRALIGFGRGLARMEFEGLRVDQSKARELFDETVGLVMNALETGVIEGGTLAKIPRRELRPRPLRGLKGRAFCAAGSPASMQSAARLGLGRMYINQPMTHAPAPFGGHAAEQDRARDHWLEAWLAAHPNETPPKSFVSNVVFVNESAEKAQLQARTYMANTFRSAVKHYELMGDHFKDIKGYEVYSALRLKPEDMDKVTEANAATAVAGTPLQVLEKLAETKRDLDPQMMCPHLYTGGMPHEEAMANIRLFAKHCLAEVQSWPTTLTIGESLQAAA
ncbi:MAG: LLM class flavin-dependent oxidoreductase [Hyphomonadaceae bacterium]|nr:LLM class flavin-dependent oxidoreductase [Hyphomonadaceae bacterium]